MANVLSHVHVPVTVRIQLGEQVCSTFAGAVHMLPSEPPRKARRIHTGRQCLQGGGEWVCVLHPCHKDA
jgi:hypothetical protein